MTWDGISDIFPDLQDKHRARTLTIHWDVDVCNVLLIGVYIDNLRDENHRTSTVTVFVAQADNSMHKIHNEIVDTVSACDIH